MTSLQYINLCRELHDSSDRRRINFGICPQYGCLLQSQVRNRWSVDRYVIVYVFVTVSTKIKTIDFVINGLIIL